MWFFGVELEQIPKSPYCFREAGVWYCTDQDRPSQPSDERFASAPSADPNLTSGIGADASYEEIFSVSVFAFVAFHQNDSVPGLSVEGHGWPT